MRSKLTFLTCCALAVGLLAACGGDDDDGGGDGGGEALSLEEFQDQAQDICAAGDEEVTQITNDATQSLQDDPGSAETVLEDTLRKLAPVMRDTANSVGELTPPEDLQSKLDDFVEQANSTADEIEADPAQFAQEAASDQSPLAELSSAAEDLGLEGCGQPEGA